MHEYVVLAMRRQLAFNTRRAPSGFTLLETLLALSLLTTLMVTIVASIGLYAQYRQRGIEGVREAKVMLGTVEDLQNDLNACFALADATRVPAIDSDATSPSTSFAKEYFLTFSDTQLRPIQFVGRSNAILLLRQGVNPRFEWTDRHPLVSESQILWLATRTQSIRLPYALDQQRPIERVYQVPNEVIPASEGLHRYWSPVVHQLMSQDTSIRGTNKPMPIWDKNTEIQQIKFRYFDGTDWRPVWDSHLQENRLPVAVEVELVLVSSPQKETRLVLRLPR